jgi:hypothetical protein
MELMAARQSDGEGLAYLVLLDNENAFIVDEGRATQVNLHRALGHAWDTETPELSAKLENELEKAIDRLQTDELVRSGRKLAQG